MSDSQSIIKLEISSDDESEEPGDSSDTDASSSMADTIVLDITTEHESQDMRSEYLDYFA